VLRLPVLLLALVLEVYGQTSREQMLISAVQQDPQNIDKVLRLAAFKLQAASGVTNEQDRAASLDEVQILYLRANSLDPRNVDALYHLGMVSWMKVFPAVVSARREAAMDPETPGPVRDRSSRAVLNAKYRADIDYAIASLEQAVALEPSNNEAMAYLQVAYRARADLKDTRAEWDADQNAAGLWREKAYEVGSAKQVVSDPDTDGKSGRDPMAPWAMVFMPSAITIDGWTMEQKLRHSTAAACPANYPSDGMRAVILHAVIDRDGSVMYLEPRDGPPEGFPAALEAARQWTFEPTLAKGKPTMVKTNIIVAFDRCPPR